MLKAFPWIVAVWCVFVYFGIVQSVLLFRHPESNRSTPYRIGVFATYLLGLIATIAFTAIVRCVNGRALHLLSDGDWIEWTRLFTIDA